jgi:glutamate/tyrosine decarboxylase-like PLP-dependent enzyme
MNLADVAPSTLTLDPQQRDGLWQATLEEIERYLRTVDSLPASKVIGRQEVLQRLEAIDFAKPMSPEAAVQFAAQGLTDFQVHASHVRYFGLFNPGSTTMGIAADALAAAFNPQVATWTHSPFATEVEILLIRELGKKFGYQEPRIDGTFCSGGAEANHTALICALTQQFPGFSAQGLRSLDRQPVLYVSQQAHHSFVKAARFCGLGTEAVRQVRVDSNGAMSSSALAKLIDEDIAFGKRPFFVAATFGTTNAGVLDPVAEIGRIAREHDLWLHVDAAWGGMAALVPELAHLCEGVEQADSITFDAHKKMSTPMGAGLLLTKHTHILGEACRITTDYMPQRAEDTFDPYTHSMQWSRRFIGLKVFLSLLVAGWEGYAAALRHQTRMGELLRSKLREKGWRVVNETALPVVCFVESDREPDAQRLSAIADRMVSSGRAWISTTRFADGIPVLRACITSYRTEPQDLEELVVALEEARI